MSTQPAGWYDDPEAPGMLRWWDGERWVNMQIPRDLAPAEPNVMQRAGGVAVGLAKLWFLLLALLFFLALVYIAL